MVIVTAVSVYAMLILLTRISGLRSFSKLSSFDFAITVAIGSTVASIIMGPTPPLVLGLFVLVVLYALQMGFAALRKRWKLIEKIIDNQPRLIMSYGTIHHDHMKAAKVTEHDLMSKLREANVLRMEDVHAVIAETTGELSVLHGDASITLDDKLLEGVRGGERAMKPRS